LELALSEPLKEDSSSLSDLNLPPSRTTLKMHLKLTARDHILRDQSRQDRSWTPSCITGTHPTGKIAHIQKLRIDPDTNNQYLDQKLLFLEWILLKQTYMPAIKDYYSLFKLRMQRSNDAIGMQEHIDEFAACCNYVLDMAEIAGDIPNS
jgi:hypothetical protein